MATHIVIITADHFPKGDLLAETVSRLVWIQWLAGQVGHWHVHLRGGGRGATLLLLACCSRPVQEGREGERREEKRREREREEGNNDLTTQQKRSLTFS